MFSTPQLVGAILLLLTPTGLAAVWFAGRDRRPPHAGKASLAADRRHRLFALCMALVPLSVFVIVSFSREVKLSWAGPLWLAFIPLMASSLPTRDGAGGTRPVLQRAWSVTFVGLIFSYGLLLHYFSLGLPGVPFRSDALLFGGADLAARVEQAVKRVEAKRGRAPVVIGMDKYRLASGLAFYRARTSVPADPGEARQPAPETTGRHLFNLEALMYAFWQAPADLAGRDLLVVANAREELDNRLFAGRGKELGRIRCLAIKKDGKAAGVYYYRLITGYRPTGLADNGGGTPPHSSTAVGPDLTTVAITTQRL